MSFLLHDSGEMRLDGNDELLVCEHQQQHKKLMIKCSAVLSEVNFCIQCADLHAYLNQLE